MNLKIFVTKFQTFAKKHERPLKLTSFFLIWTLILVTLPTIIFNQCTENILDLIQIRDNPCLKGTCIPGFYSFSCDCEPGWQGERCDQLYYKECGENMDRRGCQVQVSSEVPVYHNNSNCESTGNKTTTNVIFQMIYERTTWSEAKDKCERRGNGTTLAAFLSQKEVDLVNFNFPTLSAWIGGYATKNENSEIDHEIGHDQIDNRSWNWVAGLDGNSPEPICYSNWFWNEPNGIEKDENCLQRMFEGRWNDRICGTNYNMDSYICQIRW